MKHFDVDWAGVLDALSRWEALPRAGRAAFLKLKPGLGASAADLRLGRDELLASGLAEASPTGKRIAAREEHRSLLVTLRAMDRQRVLDTPSLTGLIDYLTEHFNIEEVRHLPPGRVLGEGYTLRAQVAGVVSSEEWVEAFLALKDRRDVERWERARTAPDDFPRLSAPDGEVCRAAQRMVRELLAHPAGIPLRELPARFPDLSPRVRAAALHAGLRYLLLYAGMRDEELEPVVGVWPEIVEELGRPPAKPPASVEPVEVFDAAFLMEDMTAVLAAAAAEPLRLRSNDYAIFARTRQAIEERLVSIPPWAARALGTDPGARVETASSLLQVLKLAHVTGKPGEDLGLAPTKKGTRWLGLPERERLASLLDPLRESPERSPPDWYDSTPAWSFFPVRVEFALPTRQMELRAPLEAAFLSLPEGFVPVDEFLAHHRRSGNPLLPAKGEKQAATAYTRWGYRRPPRRQDWERYWQEILAAFLVHRLAALGGVRLGRTPDDRLSFALAGPGRYLLGAAEGFEYGYGTEAGVIVQPDFEVLFLAPAPRAEAQIARFAERVGTGPGVVFRITRSSVLGAAEAGMGAEQIVDALAAASSREVPENVARQVHGWLRGVRRVRLRPAVLVECSDRETAARALSAGGKRLRPVTETLLELTDTDRASRSALLRKLRAAGIFVK